MSEYVKELPPPKPGLALPTWAGVCAWMRDSRDPVWHLVAADGEAKSAAGEAKYGVAHQHDNGRDHAVDAYQEHLDSCCYWWAEYQRTRSGEAYALFSAAAELTRRCRAYLLARDGR